jgi:hypothetical protein
MSMKNSNDTIGNRSRDLSVCSAVPQSLRHRLPPVARVHSLILNNNTFTCISIHDLGVIFYFLYTSVFYISML